MMNVKTGTQTWSNSAQTSSLKSEQVNNVSAEQLKKFGDQNIGDIANKIADPNWVDPAKTRKVGNNTLDKDAFLRLMLTQMKNQDPTNPLKSHEMAAQLAQFTSLEQLYNINETLTGMKKGQDPLNNFQALNFIGKSVSGDSSRITRAQGDKDHDFSFNLPDTASDVTIKVRNSSGQIVRNYQFSKLDKGQHRVTWNGLTDDGRDCRPGEYSFIVEAKGNNGQKLAVKTDFAGRITGVNYTASGPVLLIGNQSVKLSDVKKIVDSQQGPQQPPTVETESPDLSKQDTRPQIKIKPPTPQGKQAESGVDPEISNMDNVVMSEALQNKVAKEIGKDKGSEN